MPLFDRAAKVAQKQRALADGRLSPTVQYIREIIARNVCERIEVCWMCKNLGMYAEILKDINRQFVSGLDVGGGTGQLQNYQIGTHKIQHLLATDMCGNKFFHGVPYMFQDHG